MRKILQLTIIGLCLFFTTGCKKDFLKEDSIDLLRPTTTEALSQLLMGEGYPVDNGVPLSRFVDLMTDDVQINYANTIQVVNALNTWRSVFLWEREMFEQLPVNGQNNLNLWFNYYQKIKGCNVVLDHIDRVNGTDAEKANLRGQAKALRGYFYFMLVNYFGKSPAATGANPATDLGVPILLTAEVNDVPIARATVAAVYAQIEADLSEAAPLLDQYGSTNSVFRISATAVQLLLSRVYLYKGEWDKSIAAAAAVISRKPALKQLNELKPITASKVFEISNPIVSNEVIWAFGTLNDGGLLPLVGIFPNKAAYAASESLIRSHSANDLRVPLFYRGGLALGPTGLGIYYASTAKYANASAPSTKAFRVAESYLNRAEANIRKAQAGDASAITAALADINFLRRHRINNISFQDTTITDVAELFNFYKAERRREFSFEDHRWFDIKRWQEPVEHVFQSSASNQVTVKLEPGSNRYLLPIPQAVLERNANLVQNPN